MLLSKRYRFPSKYLYLNKDEVNLAIKCILLARNELIDRGEHIEDVNALLQKFLKLKAKMKA